MPRFGIDPDWREPGADISMCNKNEASSSASQTIQEHLHSHCTNSHVQVYFLMASISISKTIMYKGQNCIVAAHVHLPHNPLKQKLLATGGSAFERYRQSANLMVQLVVRWCSNSNAAAHTRSHPHRHCKTHHWFKINPTGQRLSIEIDTARQQHHARGFHQHHDGCFSL